MSNLVIPVDIKCYNTNNNPQTTYTFTLYFDTSYYLDAPLNNLAYILAKWNHSGYIYAVERVGPPVPKSSTYGYFQESTSFGDKGYYREAKTYD